jgi:formylglycine-generating enzyme required for sulfatase activity
MVRIASFCVDRYEAHLLVLATDGSMVRHPHNLRPPDGGLWVAASAAAVAPQAYISRAEAATACEAAGKRLCTRGEWRRACMGARGKTYPYGWRALRGGCNSGKEHLLHAKFGRGPWEYERHFNDPALNVVAGFLARSGEHDRCVSDDGVYDLVGNVHEWVSGTVDDSFVAALDNEPVERIEQPWTAGNAIFMGGFYSTTDQHGAGCAYTTIAHEPSYHDYSTGFRCCADAGDAQTFPHR